jgi:hypothetical protein
MEQQQQFAAWVHYAEAGESSWHKRWICFNQSSLQIFKSDKPGTKPLFSHSLSSLVAKKLASSFERRYSAIVFTLLRNFIVSFASQADLDAAVSLITRIQESVSGCLSLCQLPPACPPPSHRHASGVDLSALVAGGAAAAGEVNTSGSGTSGASTPPESAISLAKLLARERGNRFKLFSQAAAGAQLICSSFARLSDYCVAMSAQRAMDALALCVQHEVDMQVCRSPSPSTPPPSPLRLPCRQLRSRLRIASKTSCRQRAAAHLVAS